jgi:hypothetical protein
MEPVGNIDNAAGGTGDVNDIIQIPAIEERVRCQESIKVCKIQVGQLRPAAKAGANTSDDLPNVLAKDNVLAFDNGGNQVDDQGCQ